MSDWDESFDIVIAGSGGGGLTAALVAAASGKTAVVLEKQSLIGGSTAMSGGVIWAPANPLQRAAGASDSIDSALAYIAKRADYQGPATSEARQRAFLRGGADMVDFLTKQGIELEYIDGWSDYYPDGHERGRLVASKLFDTKRLGSWGDRLKTSLYSLPVPSSKVGALPLAKRTRRGFAVAMQFAWRMLVDRVRGHPRYGLGAGLIGQLLHAVIARDIAVRTNAGVTRLIAIDRRVAGVETVRDGKPWRIEARGGVLIAAGSFARDTALRERYLPSPSRPEWTVASEGDTGELLVEAQRLGAAIELADAGVWAPGVHMPDGTTQFCTASINKPHAMLVDQAGERFCNEGSSYHNVVAQMYRRDAETPSIPAWLILDSRNVRDYPFVSKPPGAVPKDWIATGFFKEAGSIAELAAKCGIPARGLEATVARFNGFAQTGSDLDFQRGDWAYDRYNGDPSVKPNPSLGAIDKPPFYAVEILPCDGGVLGGLSTDGEARVLRADGTAIAGLYASGAGVASVFGRGYPCSGGALATTFTWGYIAGRSLAANNADVVQLQSAGN